MHEQSGGTNRKNIIRGGVTNKEREWGGEQRRVWTKAELRGTKERRKKTQLFRGHFPYQGGGVNPPPAKKNRFL